MYRCSQIINPCDFPDFRTLTWTAQTGFHQPWVSAAPSGSNSDNCMEFDHWKMPQQSVVSGTTEVPGLSRSVVF